MSDILCSYQAHKSQTNQRSLNWTDTVHATVTRSDPVNETKPLLSRWTGNPFEFYPQGSATVELLTCCHVTKNCLFFHLMLPTVSPRKTTLSHRCPEHRELRWSFQPDGVYRSQAFNYVTAHQRLWSNSSNKNHWIQFLLSGFLLDPLENSNPYGYGNVQTAVGNFCLETWPCFN